MDYKDNQAGRTTEDFWFKAKKELIEVLMREALGNQNPKKLNILNIGAGTGDDLHVLNKFGNSYAIDINKDVLSLIDDKLCTEKKIADVCDLPYENNFFDAAVSSDVFEHVKNDTKAVNEVHRVLKTNGVLVFTVPAFQFLYSGHDKELNHQRRYDKKSIKRLLSPFNTMQLFYWNSIFFLPAGAFRIIKKRSEPKTDQINIPGFMNYLFYKLLLIDSFLIKRNKSAPIGLSLAGWCKK